MINDVIIQNGRNFSVVGITATHDKLPVGNYLVQYNELKGFYLEQQPEFAIPEKIYGDLSYVHRWKKTFDNSTRNLGILLSGYKGNGKTLAAQYFCKLMGLPVIFITKGYSEAEFESFITNPALNNSIIFIDEFEKYYGEDSDYEDALLSIMDGIYTTHNIFLLTVNASRLISDKLKNRLGRIKYHKQYFTIEESIVNDAIDDLLIHKEHRDSIKNVLDLIPTISFDIITTLIREVNLFNESAEECIKHLNIVKESVHYEISVFNGKHREFPGSRYIIIPDGTFNLYYDNDIPDDTWPQGRVNLRDYTLEKISGGVKFKYNDTYEITLIRADIESFFLPF